MGKNKKSKSYHRPFHRKPPPRMLPQSRKKRKGAFVKYKQSKWRSPVPDDYKKVAKALAAVQLQNANLASMINPHKKFQKESYALALKAINHAQEVDYLLEKFDILKKNKFLDQWMAKVLITEMLWGKQFLKSSSNPVEAIKYYAEDLRDSFIEVMTLFPNPDNASVTPALPTYIRINALSMSVEDAVKSFINEGGRLLPRSKTYSEHLKVLANLRGNEFMRDYHIYEILIFAPGASFYKHPGYLQGYFLLQDKGSCLSSFLLSPTPGSTVLDICAAPGMKTNHIANIMNNTGVICAYDIHPDRFTSLSKTMDLTKVRCVKKIQGDFLHIQSNQDVDYITVDHTSTYSGIFSKRPRRGQLKRITRSRFSLSRALRFSLQNFPNAKRVVYTVCSVFPEECEQVVDDALKEVGDSYTLVNLKEKLGYQWTSFGSSEYAFGDKCIHTVPEVDLCQGHFIAVFERNFNVPVPPYEKRATWSGGGLKRKNNSEEETGNDSDIDFCEDAPVAGSWEEFGDAGEPGPSTSGPQFY